MSTVRWAGLAAMLGGALFVVSATLIASMPRGCIGDECATRPMRETGAAGAIFAGLVFSGGAILRTGILPWRILPLTLGLAALLPIWVLALVHFELPVVLLGLGWMLLGYAMWKGDTYRISPSGSGSPRAGDSIPVSQPGRGRDRRPGH